MTDEQVAALRQSTQDLFYHGFDNYMDIAFPEDELKPITCQPQTRNRENPADIGLNDVLGNYSLTLIDSLSTLAILASGPQHKKGKRNPLGDFQNGVKSLVELYGDGTDAGKCGSRACGFDLDSKVQVFETNIRGVGGLLSAHLFATGDLPIQGYQPVWKQGRKPGIKWKNGMRYDGQLLRLAYDLAQRLLPAFSTPTDIPYPRVNLRHGIPFYRDAETGVCRLDGTSTDPREITENCAAGAGSLVLEFAALSRLTGDARFENVGKKAFWAIWKQRSSINLLGNGIDAETAEWTRPALSGIGAGIDSFFEYSLKSHIMLSNLPYDPRNYSTEAPESFLHVWKQAHAGVKRHIYRGPRTVKHPFYGVVDPESGGDRYSWIDNLSAYYPGLLVLAGELDEAIEAHLLWSALWTRFGALPERWHVGSSALDPNFKHWAGRPEFIESTFYLYQATKDPYYMHVGEMALRNIRARCWTNCGWADLGDVNTGEQRDRMESFFLGETAKYLYLLFTADHPLNRVDRPIVFTTEGHPLVIPAHVRASAEEHPHKIANRRAERLHVSSPATCPAPPDPLPLTVSNIANRADLFHAAALAQLHTIPIPLQHHSSPLEKQSQYSPGISFADVDSPTNYTFYPWTLPQSLVPVKGSSAPIINPVTSTLTFPALGTSALEVEKGIIPLGAMQKVQEGILVNSLSNMRIGMVQEPKSVMLPDGQGVLVEQVMGDEFRINTIANFHLGKDERVLLTGTALKDVSPADPHFTRQKDSEMIDLVLDIPTPSNGVADVVELEASENGTFDAIWDELDNMLNKLLPGSGSDYKFADKLRGQTDSQSLPTLTRQYIPAILPTGKGSTPPGPGMDIDVLSTALGQLPQRSIFFLDDMLCDKRLPASIAKQYQILIVMRGGCSFNDKLANIPYFTPMAESLQLVVVVSGPAANENDIGNKGEHGLIRPLLDLEQRTPTGLDRKHPIAMCMVDGSMIPPRPQGSHSSTSQEDDVSTLLRRVATAQGSFGESGKLQEVRSTGVSDGKANKIPLGRGMGVKRRYWFESMGVPIGNLMMV
ncbi:Putative glycoside hydrolase family 47, six-hairpin glycosidase-like superfamily [Septoria linicola]|uniref:alpha-1,2-Mannosidase n=1 Tax=Septoria linicola TaxID=215465 RepID=A0A9Q9EGJ3_9PEZI|nr:Putative glycoside hydrolase family 47, six-hairpin glycosidase-like superfamily [Septoria linicola]